jgi:hypothetical protein
MLMLPAGPFRHHGSLQRVMQKSQNNASPPSAETAEFISPATFGTSGDEIAVRTAGLLEWQLQPVRQIRSHQCGF